MNRFFLSLVTMAIGSLLFAAAPDFNLKDLDGNTHTLSQYKGKVVVVEWFSHHCPFVKKFYDEGHMQKWQETYTGKGVIWLSINSSAPGKPGNASAEKHKQVAESKETKSTAILIDEDGKAGKAFGAKVTPHIFIIGADGEIAYQGAVDNKKSTRTGDIAGATNFISKALDELIAGKPVSTKKSQAYGCSVKY